MKITVLSIATVLLLSFVPASKQDTFTQADFDIATYVLSQLNDKAMRQNPADKEAANIFLNAFKQMEKYGTPYAGSKTYFNDFVTQFSGNLPDLQIGVGTVPSSPGSGGFTNNEVQTFSRIKAAGGLTNEDVDLLIRIKQEQLNITEIDQLITSKLNNGLLIVPETSTQGMGTNQLLQQQLQEDLQLNPTQLQQLEQNLNKLQVPSTGNQ